MKKCLLLLLLFSLYFFPGKGQQLPGLSTSSLADLDLTDSTLIEDIIRCYSVEYHELRKKNNPSIPSTKDFEDALAAEIEAAQAGDTDNGILQGVLQIPVIVHVVHFGEAVGSGTNIAAEQVYSQIEVMNEDFRRMSGSRGFNDDPRGADVQIEFVPALIDPDGNMLEEPGIHRYRGPLPAYVLEEIDLLIKPATIYDPNRYLNMWTVNFAALLLGYAQFPDPAHGFAAGLGCDTGESQTDGVVMAYSSFGSSEKYPEGTYSAPYDLGRTVTHEVGHWLGLRHIWGDGGCGVDDYCGDTPESDGSNSGCNLNDVSCGSVDMVQNYMDYTYDACMNIFTNDQSLRMRTVLSKSPRRRELLSSTVHLEPVALDAAIIDIVSPKGQRCNSNMLPEVLLRNLGQSTLHTVTINYQVDGGALQSYQWNGALATGDIELVTLPAIATTEGNHTLTAYTSAPNGGSDAYAHNDEWSGNFIISTVGEKLDFLETFDSGLYPPSNKWAIENEDHCESWSPYSNISGANGELSTTVFLNYYDYNAKGTTDGLQLPLINLSTTEEAMLEFDVGYAASGSAQDRLEVLVSVDCGITFKSIYNKAGSELATAPEAEGAFYPAADQWRRESISLNNYRTDQVVIKFVGTNDYGNNLFLDNIYVSGASEEAEPVALKKFTAAQAEGGVELQWLTASEENYLHFELERSGDGGNFAYAQTIEAKKGTSSGSAYKTLDTEASSGTAYYRLKIVRDHGLNPLYSQTISIKSKGSGKNGRTTAGIDAANEPLRLQAVYPNPSKGTFELSYEATYAGEVRIQLMDMLGKVVHTTTNKVQKGQNMHQISANGLSKGFYFLILNGPGQQVKEKILIQ